MVFSWRAGAQMSFFLNSFSWNSFYIFNFPTCICIILDGETSTHLNICTYIFRYILIRLMARWKRHERPRKHTISWEHRSLSSFLGNSALGQKLLLPEQGYGSTSVALLWPHTLPAKKSLQQIVKLLLTRCEPSATTTSCLLPLPLFPGFQIARHKSDPQGVSKVRSLTYLHVMLDNLPESSWHFSI